MSAYTSDTTVDTSDWRSSEESGEAEINKINYVPVREMTTEEGRKLAKQNNELVALMRKQAYAVLEEDKRTASAAFRGRSSRQGRSDYSSRSSSSWSTPRRSRSREKRSTRRREWRGHEKRRKSGDRNRRRSKDRDYKKKSEKYDKKNEKHEYKRLEMSHHRTRSHHKRASSRTPSRKETVNDNEKSRFHKQH